LEDAHWIDPTSLDVFSRLVDRLSSLRALLVITFRPDFAPPWVGRAHVASLALNRFARRQVVAMIDRITGGKALPAEVLEQIVARTDGVPLFVEELTKTVLESDLLREESEAYILRAALTPLAIPSTLQDSLMARLDRLAPVRETAQIAAAIGREFSYRLLESVSPIRGAALQNALGQLVAAELIHARGAPADATYVFKHALVQDTAYASLLRSRRQRIHADIAGALEERVADQIEAAPAIIAHHYTEAGLNEPAVRHWLKAAELALSHSALAEAGRYVGAGLARCRHLTDETRQSLELALQLVRANALLPLKGYSHPETVAALTAAKRLLDAGVGSDLQHFSALFGLCAASVAAAQMEPALALARQLVELADRQDDTTYRLVGYRVLGTIQLYTGHAGQALESLQQAERYRVPGRQRLLSFRFGGDPDLIVLGFKILALMFLGLDEQAARVSEQVRVELSDHSHASTVASCTFLAVLWREFVLGDLEACERRSADLVAYCTEKKVEQFRLFGCIFRAYARAMKEPTGENVAAIRAAIDAEHQSGARIFDSVHTSQLAEALLMAGDLEAAEAAVRDGLIFVERSGERFWLAELHRLSGRIRLRRPEPERAGAAACFLRAIEVARSQEARLLELRAATDLARL
jgi:hypothetical protein